MRETTERDLSPVARIHRKELPHGLFPELGVRFLRAYHRSFLDSPHAVSSVATLGDDVVGFIAGTVDQHAHHDWVLRHHGLRLAMWGVLGLLSHPRTLWWFLRTRVGRYLRAMLRAATRRVGSSPTPNHASGAASHGTHDSATGPISVLTHVAVTPAARGKGLGAALTKDFAATAHRRGSREVRLVTRADDGAAEFYEALQWQRTDSRDRDGTQMLEYRLPGPGSSGGAR